MRSGSTGIAAGLAGGIGSRTLIAAALRRSLIWTLPLISAALGLIGTLSLIATGTLVALRSRSVRIVGLGLRSVASSTARVTLVAALITLVAALITLVAALITLVATAVRATLVVGTLIIRTLVIGSLIGRTALV